jgi:outer membrane lipoprotein-sorting protein
MLWSILLVVALNTDPIALAAAQYRALESYQVTLHATDASGDTQVIRYFYRKPGQVRMEFIQPQRGAVLVYDPGARRVRLWPFGFGTFPSMTLSPDNPFIRSPRGQQVDRSDVGALLDNVRTLQQGGSTEARGEEVMGQWQTLHVVVTGPARVTVAGVHRYQLWLAQPTLFPVKVESWDLQDRLIESVLMDDVEFNVDFPEGFFEP